MDTRPSQVTDLHIYPPASRDLLSHYLLCTGQQSWGIAWYINGLLIPEITLRRHQKVTFKVEGGRNSSNSARFHPFYITDDPQGGYNDKDEVDRAVGIPL